MRILYYHRTLADGAEGIHIAEMVDAFRQLGHEVSVEGMTPCTGSQHPGPVHRVRAMLPQPLVEIASLAYNVPGSMKVRRHMSMPRLDVMYARHARFDLAPLLVAHRRGVPIVLEVNAVYSARPYSDFEPLVLRGVAERLERRAFDLASVVVAVSTPLARQVHALAPAAKLAVIPNAANPARFDPARADRRGVRARLGLGDRLTVGWTGILRDWHGLDVLLGAMSSLPDAWLLVVGDGPARRALEQRAASVGMGARLIITGRVAYADMPDHIAAMDIAVVSDERTGVASPMKLLEYMAMGRAVLAPSLENISDVAGHEVNALLFTPDSPRDLESMLRRLAADPVLRDGLGSRARATVERERNWRRNAETVLGLLPADDAPDSPMRLEAGPV